MRGGGSRVSIGGCDEGLATVGAAARGRPRFRDLSDERGFTFVELLAALLLLGILVALAVPSYFGSENTARSKVDQSNVQAINAALALYKFNNGGACPPDQATFAGANFLGGVPRTSPMGLLLTPGVGGGLRESRVPLPTPVFRTRIRITSRCAGSRWFAVEERSTIHKSLQ